MTDETKNNKLIIPNKGATKLICLPSKKMRQSAATGELMEAVTKHCARAKSDIFNEIANMISGFRYTLDESLTPMVATETTPESEIRVFKKTMPHYNLVTIDESPSRELLEHLGFLVETDVLDIQDERLLKGHIFYEFARRARGIETIVRGDLESMSSADPARRFLDGSFFNNNVRSINGDDKIHVREHLSTLHEQQLSAKPAKVIEFKPRT